MSIPREAMTNFSRFTKVRTPGRPTIGCTPAAGLSQGAYANVKTRPLRTSMRQLQSLLMKNLMKTQFPNNNDNDSMTRWPLTLAVTCNEYFNIG